MPSPYWLQEALQALLVIAFFAHFPYAAASFFGLAADGGLALSMHDAAPELQPWIESIMAWQSVFFPHAAAGFAHVLSMHLPQSVSPRLGVAGAEGAAADAAGAESELPLVSPPDDAGAAVVSEPDESAGAAEEDEEDPPSSDELSSAGVSGGFPPPHAIHTNGAARRTTAERAVVERGAKRVMSPMRYRDPAATHSEK